MKSENIHMLGICGSGMTPLALLLKKKGNNVGGCDKSLNENALLLESEGIKTIKGHSPDHLKGVDKVVYSRAVNMKCEEIQKALSIGLPVFSRGEALSNSLVNLHLTGVAGTHGKTTTVSMLVHILRENGVDILGIAGGAPFGWESGLCWSDKENAVCELDESDKTFLLFFPKLGVITSIEADHIGKYYSGEEEILAAFRQFEDNSERCIIHVCDSLTAYAAEGKKAKTVTLGEAMGCDLKYSFDEDSVLLFGQKIKLKMPGKHNLQNAAVAVAAAEEMGVRPEKAAESLLSFRGLKRRMEVVFNYRDRVLISDYAHHPTELRFSLNALKSVGKKITAIFQPHLFSRTKDFHESFADALSTADELIILPIYPAREEPIPGVTSELIIDDLQKLGKKAYLAQTKDQMLEILSGLKPCEVIALLGAGDIDSSKEEVKKILKEDK